VFWGEGCEPSKLWGGVYCADGYSYVNSASHLALAGGTFQFKGNVLKTHGREFGARSDYAQEFPIPDVTHFWLGPRERRTTC